jgi:hypothetical protein
MAPSTPPAAFRFSELSASQQARALLFERQEFFQELFEGKHYLWSRLGPHAQALHALLYKHRHGTTGEFREALEQLADQTPELHALLEEFFMERFAEVVYVPEGATICLLGTEDGKATFRYPHFEE